MLAKAILVHGVIGYKFCRLLPFEDHNQGTPAGRESNGTIIRDHWEDMNQLRHQLGTNHGTSRSLWQPTSHGTMLLGDIRVQTSSWSGCTSEAIKNKGTIIVTKFDGERSTCCWFAPIATPFTWHKSNHLLQFFTCTRWTGTTKEYASTQ